MKSPNKIDFENTYANELNGICERCSPTSFNKSEILLRNYSLAAELGIDESFLDSNECLDIFSGRIVSENSIPIAQAYSGHQYGNFNPQMGDGRAILLGEINQKDIQLKGSGQTPFSKRGDGKSALGPVLREYVISEFMNSVNIPTTRSLMAIKSNENVFRDEETPGGILARVANSHIRIGTFEYVSYFKPNSLETLADYVIKRHYPELYDADNKYISLFAAICDKQSFLISKWMGVGFVHGVMNTDNMLVSGETIDYGPCAFMDEYNPSIYFSSIDKHGRYSYKNQPAIMIWNLSKLAEAFIPLVDKNKEKAVIELSEVLNLAMPTYQEYFYIEMSKKFGLKNVDQEVMNLVNNYLKILMDNSVDFVLSFRDLGKLLSDNKKIDDTVFKNVKNFNNWYFEFLNLLSLKKLTKLKVSKTMDSYNPCYIPRNHLVEDAIINAVTGDMKKINLIAELLKEPFTEKNGYESYTEPSYSDERYVTYCGT